MNDTPSPSNEQFKDLTRFSLLLEGKETDVEKLQARSLYDHLISKMSATPTAMKKYNETYNTENFQLDWEKIYSLSFQTKLDTKLREFQYKVLNRICYTNKMLFKFRIVDSPLCYFCNEEIETLEHFFFYCERVRIFWNEVNNILQPQKLFSIPFDVKDIFFGMAHTVNNKVLINYIILEGKYFIYRSKLNKSPLSISLFLEKCKRTYQIERFIARNNKTLYFHDKKWEPLLPLLDQ